MSATEVRRTGKGQFSVTSAATRLNKNPVSKKTAALVRGNRRKGQKKKSFVKEELVTGGKGEGSGF